MARDLEVGVTITAEDQASRILAAFGDNLGKVGDDTSTLAGALRRLGVELEENVEKKIEANNKVLGAAAKAFTEGRISAEDFARAQKKIEAANEKLSTSIRTVTESASGSTGTFSKLGSFLKDSFVITLGDVANGVRKAGEFVKSFITAASESEDAVKQLDNALSSLGAGAGKVSSALQDQAASLQKVTRFSDDAIIRGQAFLATFVKNEDVLKRSTSAATDLSAALGIDLQNAFELLAKAAQGNTASLSRYGIVLDESIPSGQKFEALLSKISQTMGGRAAADAETFTGAMEQVKNALNDLEEVAGRAVTSSATVVQSLKDMRDTASDPKTVEGVSALARGFTGMFAGISAGLIEKLGEVGIATQVVGDAASEAGLDVGQLFTPAVIEAKGETDRWFGTLLDAGTPFRVVTESVSASTGAIQANAEEMRRNEAVYSRVASAQGELASAATKLGVTLETNVNSAIAENNAALEKFRDALQKGIISSATFERAQAANAAANALLVASLSPVPASLDAVAAGQSAVSATARSAAESESAFAQQLLLTGEGFATHLIRLNQVKAAYAALGEQAQTAAQKITGANDSMLGPLDKPGDPLPSNLGRTRGGVSLPAGVAGTATSNYFTLNTPLYGQVQAFKVASQGVGSGLATTFYTLPNGRVVTDDYTLWAVNPTLNPPGRF